MREVAGNARSPPRLARQLQRVAATMETTAYIALSRQMALRRQMDLIANNIANATASGFKAEALIYEPVVSDAGRGQRLAFVQDVGVARDLRARADDPDRQSARPGDRGPRLFRHRRRPMARATAAAASSA